MKLYLLEPVKNLPKKDSPWEPWYDKCFGMVIRAYNEEEARLLADGEGESENDGWSTDYSTVPTKVIRKSLQPWLDNKYSTCIELIPEGEKEVIIKNVANA